jgi:hypothetical protein
MVNSLLVNKAYLCHVSNTGEGTCGIFRNTVEPLISGLGFTGPRFIRPLLGSQNQKVFPTTYRRLVRALVSATRALSRLISLFTFLCPLVCLIG